MIDAADAIPEAENFSRWIGGVAPGAGFREIAPADVPGLKIAEDDQRRRLTWSLAPRSKMRLLDKRTHSGSPTALQGTFQWDRTD